MYDVAVILINYNSAKHTINCVESVINKTSNDISCQIIITDNRSEIDDYNLLKDYCEKLNCPHLELHRSEINIGFGGGNMYGVKYTNAEYFLFLNNDTYFLNDCISIVKKHLDSNSNIGIAGAQAFKENGDFMISLDHFASPVREILGRSFMELTNPKKYPKRKKKYTEPLQVNFVPGSFMFVRAKDFYEAGGFDTNIFLYYEETDLCIRLLKNNKPAFLIPDAHFVHLHGASTEKSLVIKKELKISLLYVIQKHYGNFGYFLVRTHLIIKYGISSVFKSKNRPLFGLVWRGAPIEESLGFKNR